MDGPDGSTDTGATLTLHATCVAWAGRGLLILGSSGSGKSSLALQALAYGCCLIADDRTIVTSDGPGLIARAPDATAGLIEARHLGILAADPGPPCRLALVLDLDETETARLPPQRSVTYLHHPLPLIYRPVGGHVAAAVLQYLKAGRSA